MSPALVDGRPLRVLHVLRAPLGGLFRHVLDLTRGQIERGHEVGLIADSLTGGLGADHFVYAALTDSTVKAGGQDVITDFSHGDGDLIDLSALDADTADGADTAFHLVDGDFTHHAGELIQTAQAGGYLVRGDVNGDGATDFALFVHTASTLIAADFVL